ncbi:MAG TPA: hypothetical protein IAD05_08180 [Candidatus Faecousia gallistercoris]|nr:hypothetical protein [Candidatus Faecousia gallistercoris]
MSAYSDYFDRQSPSVELRRRLLTLPESGPRRRRTAPLAFAGAAAACCLLALCLLLRPGDEAAPDPALNQTPEPSAPQSGSEAEASRQFPEIQYGSGAGGVAADIALPDGHFQEDLTQEELAALFGETGWWEALGWTLSGYAVYDGEGRLWQVFLSGSGGTDGAYTLALAPDRLPAACVETDSQEINDIWGTEVSAGRVHFDCDGDDAEEFCYTLSFLRDETLGARLEVTDENSATGQALVESILARLLDPDRPVCLDFLTPEEIPAWRSEELTLPEARQEADFAAYLPEDMPEGFQWEGAWLEMGQGRYELTLNWSRDSADLSITVDRMPELRQSCMADLNDPATYDLRLYPVPRGESIPEAYWDSVQDPIFPAEAMTRDLLEARAEGWDGTGSSFQFQILYPDGVLVRYRATMSLSELWLLLEPAVSGRGA